MNHIAIDCADCDKVSKGYSRKGGYAGDSESFESQARRDIDSWLNGEDTKFQIPEWECKDTFLHITMKGFMDAEEIFDCVFGGLLILSMMFMVAFS